MTFHLAEAQANQSVVVLVTGFVVVFAVLLLLIGIIKLYGGIVYGITNKKKKKVIAKNIQEETAPQKVDNTSSATPAMSSGDYFDLETVAVIAAAVEAYYGGSGIKPRVKSVRRSSPVRNEWSTAGLADNISSRRGF